MTKYSEAMENIKVTDEMRSRILQNVALRLEKSKENEEEESSEKEQGKVSSEEKSENITEFRPSGKKFRGVWIAPVGLTAAAALILVIVRPWSGSSLMSASSPKGAANYEASMSAETTTEDYYDAVAEASEAVEEYDDSYPVYEEEAAAGSDSWSEEETKDNSEGIEGMVFDAAEFSSARELSDAVGFEIKDISSVPFESTEVIYRVISGKLAEIVYLGDGEKLTIRKSAGAEDNSGDYNDYSVHEPIETAGNKVDILGYEEGYYLVTWYDGEYYHSVRSDNPLSLDRMEEIISDVIGGEK